MFPWKQKINIEIFPAPKMFILEIEVNLNYFKFEYSCTAYFIYFSP